MLFVHELSALEAWGPSAWGSGAEADAGKVGVIGYCSGGRQSYLAAYTLRGLDAAIDCHGGGVVAKPEELT